MPRARAPERQRRLSSEDSGKLEPFLLAVRLIREEVLSFERYPFCIPAVRSLHELSLHPRVTYFVGENGSGKSTLIEALAIAAGFKAEGGSRNFNFSTRRSESTLHQHLRLVRSTRRPKTGYFLRAESFYNVATEVDGNDSALMSHGGRSLHEQSHGEAFLALLNNRFGPNGLYLLDEPEAALSPQRQLSFLAAVDALVRGGNSQFIISTHSPIVLAYPDARIYHLGKDGVAEVAYEETEQVALTRDFLSHRERYLRRLLGL
jgi:predicted ATPase